jgi:predicted MFS family arabinose efflux permease
MPYDNPRHQRPPLDDDDRTSRTVILLALTATGIAIATGMIYSHRFSERPTELVVAVFLGLLIASFLSLALSAFGRRR